MVRRGSGGLMPSPPENRGSGGALSAPPVNQALWMAVGVLAISTSPILIRVAAMPALAMAFWRCLAGAAVLTPFASRGGAGLTRGDLLPLATSGVCLAAHFALWNASLGLTTVAAATTLVSMAPLFVGFGSVFLGEPPTSRAWAGIVLATAGAVAIGAGDAVGFGSGSRALLGDVLAFAGALAMAGYLLLGRVVRRPRPRCCRPACSPGPPSAATARRPGWPWPGW